MIELGKNLNCRYCKYACCEIVKNKVKKIFCAKFQSYISISVYNKMRFCNFYDKR